MRPVAYSVSNVLQLVGISRTKFYQVVGSGQLKIRKIGNRTIILAADLEAWLDSLPRSEKGERE
jgi:excisionase family DNA binding protein